MHSLIKIASEQTRKYNGNQLNAFHNILSFTPEIKHTSVTKVEKPFAKMSFPKDTEIVNEACTVQVFPSIWKMALIEDEVSDKKTISCT